LVRFLFLLLLIIPLSACLAQDADSLDTASDSLSTGEDDEFSEAGEDTTRAQGRGPGRGPGRRRRPGRADSSEFEGPAGWLLNTHPNYKMSVKKRKDVTNWNTEITLNRWLSDKLSLGLSATLNTRENSTLERTDASDAATARLEYYLNDAISFGMVYNSGLISFRNDYPGAPPPDRKKRQDINVSGDLEKRLTESVEVGVQVSAGNTENSYTSISNRGSRQDLSTSLTYAPTPDLTASVNFNGKRLELDSQVDSSGAAVFSSEDQTFSQDLGLSVAYKMVPGVRINLNAAQGESRKQHPDPQEKIQESEERSQRRASASAAFELFERVTWDASVSFSESEASFVVKSQRDNRIENASLSGSMKIEPWPGGKVNLGGKRETKRSEYVTDDTGSDVQKSLSLRVNQELGPKARVNLTALTDLASVYYDDKESNNKDRDRRNSRVSMDLNYAVRDHIQTRLAGEFSEERSVYTQAASSANNRTTRRYRVSGDYDLESLYHITLSQKIEISAVYTYYHFDEDNNSLVRNSDVTTRVMIPVVRSLKVNLNHNFKHQDQGSYSEEGGTRFYGLSGERETNVMGISCNYSLGRNLRLIFRHNYQIQRNWKFEDGEKSLDSEYVLTDFSGRVKFSYEFGERTTLSLSIEQNWKDGTRVNEAFRDYRNVEFQASHVF
jgi:hypothetical protein